MDKYDVWIQEYFELNIANVLDKCLKTEGFPIGIVVYEHEDQTTKFHNIDILNAVPELKVILDKEDMEVVESPDWILFIFFLEDDELRVVPAQLSKIQMN